MSGVKDIFGAAPALIGMVHVQALPGTPGHGLSMAELVRRAVADAEVLLNAGFDALLVENMHDVPYLRRVVGPEIVAGMTVVAKAIRKITDRPLGIQILAGANAAALAVAHAVGGQFIRAEGFVFASVADEGLLDEADAGPLLRLRKTIGAEAVKILADVKKKHSAHAITADMTIAETARAVEFFGADGVVVTGVATGEPVSLADLEAVAASTSLPVLVGSGVTAGTAPELLARADALIAGSWCKRDGHWRNEVDPGRARELAEAVARVRATRG